MAIKECEQQFLTFQNIQDIHIHPRPDCFSINVLCHYVNLCIGLGISKVGFLEHGRRVLKNHQGVLNNKNDILNFVRSIEKIKNKKEYHALEIKCGIEIDYSTDSLIVENMLRECAKVPQLDYIIGSVHGFSKKPYGEYINAVLNLIRNYNIDILGHFILSEDSVNYWTEIEQMLDMLHSRQIALELNKAERYDCKNFKLKKSFLQKVLIRDVRLVFGSDAHSYLELIRNNSRNWL